MSVIVRLLLSLVAFLIVVAVAGLQGLGWGLLGNALDWPSMLTFGVSFVCGFVIGSIGTVASIVAIWYWL